MFPHHSAVTAWKGVTSGAIWTLQKKKHICDGASRVFPSSLVRTLKSSSSVLSHVRTSLSVSIQELFRCKSVFFVVRNSNGDFLVEMNAFLQPSSIKQSTAVGSTESRPAAGR